MGQNPVPMNTAFVIKVKDLIPMTLSISCDSFQLPINTIEKTLVNLCLVPISLGSSVRGFLCISRICCGERRPCIGIEVGNGKALWFDPCCGSPMLLENAPIDTACHLLSRYSLLRQDSLPLGRQDVSQQFRPGIHTVLSV